jgi:hypothetical protein
MSIGTYISVTMHAGMVILLLLNGDFERDPREISVTEISVVSAEMFDIALNNTPPEIAATIDTALVQPTAEETAPKLSIKPDTFPPQRVQPLMEPPQNVETPPDISDLLARVEDLIIIPPAELLTPAILPAPSDSLETSLKPKPRAASRITSKAVAPSEPDVDIGDFTRDAASPQDTPAEIKEAQAAAAPEASASEIVPEEVEQTAALAPEQSTRPQIRRVRQVVETEKKDTSSVVTIIDPLAAALSEALTGSTPDSGSETVVVNLNQLTQGLSQAIDEAIGPCNNVNMSTAAEQTTILVSVSFDSNAKIMPKSLDMVEFLSGDAGSVNVRFEAAKRTLANWKCRDDVSEVIRGYQKDELLFSGQIIEIEFGPIDQF